MKLPYLSHHLSRALVLLAEAQLELEWAEAKAYASGVDMSTVFGEDRPSSKTRRLFDYVCVVRQEVEKP